MTEPVFTTLTAPGAPALWHFPGLDPAGGEPGGAVAAATGPAGPLVSTPPDHPATGSTLRALARAVGLRDAAWCRQVHGARVVAARGGGLQGEGDALVTDRPGLALCGFGADCPLIPAVGHGRGGRLVAGLAHASWRSTVAGVAAKMIGMMVRDFGVDPGGIAAGICPSAGPCCYAVGPEVRDAALARLGPHAAEFFTEAGGSLRFDLWRANADALTRAGVPAERVFGSGVCTICSPLRYPSFRRDGTRERIVALAGARPAAATA